MTDVSDRQQPGQDVSPIRLLIIEDDEDQRELIREVLEQHFGPGTVVAVGTRAQALGEDWSSFDLILTDYNLPDASGMDLLDEILASCQTPVIMVTGENVAQTAAQAIQRGAIDYIVKFGDYLFTIPLEVEKSLIIAKGKRERETLQRELMEKNAQLQTAMRQLEELAATDPLTSLYNRRHFGRVLEQLFDEARRFDKDLACVMIDLDEYKKLNDTYGHQVGDQLLVTAGKVISANMRRMDIAARYGGDEFVLLLPQTSTDEATGVGQRIRDDFARASSRVLSRPRGVTMSMGVASLHLNHPATPDLLVASADQALYKAKAHGRDQIHTAQASHRSDVSKPAPITHGPGVRAAAPVPADMRIA